MAEGEQGNDDTRLEIAIAIGLGLAAILTALCVYLTDVHDDKAQLAFNTGIRDVTEASSGYVQASQLRADDEAKFLEYATRLAEGDSGANYVLRNLARPELQAMIDWWTENALAKGIKSPFVEENPEFTQPELAAAQEKTDEANEQLATAQDELNEGDSFIIASVIVATALFLFGVAGVATVRRLKIGSAVLGYAVFALSLVIVLVNV